MACFSAPKTGSVNIIEKFGKFQTVRKPGLSILWPCIGQYKAGTVSLRLQSLTVRCETKTLDNGAHCPAAVSSRASVALAAF
jgi:regulator of protease activity HflC (stomatin/prohibitin superfamily)